jgi:hypothetical protein
MPMAESTGNGFKLKVNKLKLIFGNRLPWDLRLPAILLNGGIYPKASRKLTVSFSASPKGLGFAKALLETISVSNSAKQKTLQIDKGKPLSFWSLDNSETLYNHLGSLY